jgi:hypothetical protein
MIEEMENLNMSVHFLKMLAIIKLKKTDENTMFSMQ